MFVITLAYRYNIAFIAYKDMINSTLESW
jgi:hypothetical protein